MIETSVPAADFVVSLWTVHPTFHCFHLVPILQARKSLPFGGTLNSLWNAELNRWQTALLTWKSHFWWFLILTGLEFNCCRQWRDKLSKVTSAGSWVMPVGTGMKRTANPLHMECLGEGVWKWLTRLYPKIPWHKCYQVASLLPHPSSLSMIRQQLNQKLSFVLPVVIFRLLEQT